MTLDTKIMSQEKQDLVRSMAQRGFRNEDIANAFLLAEIAGAPSQSDQPDWVIQRQMNLRKQVNSVVANL